MSIEQMLREKMSFGQLSLLEMSLEERLLNKMLLYPISLESMFLCCTLCLLIVCYENKVNGGVSDINRSLDGSTYPGE